MAKQKRSDQQIDDYYEKIRQEKQEKLFHEKEMNIVLPPNAYMELTSKVNVSKYKNMRHLNKEIKDSFVQYISGIMKTK